MAVAHMLKLVMHWSGLGEEGTLQWNFGGNAASHDPAALTDAAGNAVDKWTNNLSPSSKTNFLKHLWPSQSVDKVTLYEYAEAPGPATALGEFAVTGWVGTAVTLNPLQVAQVASARTALAGASYRGRQYFPSQGSTVVATTGLTVPAAADQLAALAANMGTDAVAGIQESLAVDELLWGVYSPKKGIITPIVAIVADDKMYTQRRREASLDPAYSALIEVNQQ